MGIQKKPIKIKQLKQELLKEVNFIKTIFTFYSAPNQLNGNENQLDFEITNNKQKDIDVPKRAHSIAELEEKLEKMKSQQKFNLKSKLIKKSLTSKLNKKIKKKERVKLNKNKIKEVVNSSEDHENEIKPKISQAKPVFNTEGKLVFSKFDFANLGQKERAPKGHKDAKKKLDELKQQEQKVHELTEKDGSKAKDLKEKIAWKNILQKAEGQKVKDDPILLKKSIKRQEQKKKASKKQWENRIKSVADKMDERQKKRKENIIKKKKEKKVKKVKASVKRGRVVI
ncbi:surfeit locus protein 6 homolog [Zerene cesonia]|uniref:surfeit locus protein 6 homolog n=1 Tax=Zerene cesonia TaxID=33412 RepID=UPI0018E54E34|nr:surfeit locus protein 6 homolog [Zerene cesonia]